MAGPSLTEWPYSAVRKVDRKKNSYLPAFPKAHSIFGVPLPTLFTSKAFLKLYLPRSEAPKDVSQFISLQSLHRCEIFLFISFREG